MSIGIIINELDICGGTHKQVLRLAQYLQKNKIDFEVITKYYDLSSSYPEFQQFDIKRLFSVKGNAVSSQTIIDKIKTRVNVLKFIMIVSLRHNILNFHDNGYGFGLMMILFKLLRRTIIWQINDLPPCFFEGNAKSTKDNIRNSLARFWYKIVAKYFVDEITVNVSKNAERVMKHFQRNATVFHCGTDSLQAERHSKTSGGKFNILSSGVFLKYRNYETQLLVLKRLLENDIECELNIVGSTKLDSLYYESICDLADKLDLNQNLKIHGQVDNIKLLQLHNDADVFIFINIDQSWGLAVFEAMSVGLPVIVSESVGAVELLTNGNDSVIVDPMNVDMICDVLIRLINDVDYYRKISDGAYNKAASLSWDNMYSFNMLSMFKDYLRT